MRYVLVEDARTVIRQPPGPDVCLLIPEEAGWARRLRAFCEARGIPFRMTGDRLPLVLRTPEEVLTVLVPAVPPWVEVADASIELLSRGGQGWVFGVGPWVLKVTPVAEVRRAGFPEVRLSDLGVPGVMPVLGRVESGPWLLVLMPRAEGSLSTCPWPLRALAQAARALESLHARGWVHLDVKPDNILWAGPAQAWLADGGSALPDGAVREALRVTLAYSAPEVVAGLHMGHAIRVRPPMDVWSLAITAHEALTGVHPFGTSARITRFALLGDPPPDVRADALPEGLRDVLRASLDPDPDARPGADVWARALESAVVGGEG